MDDNSNYIYVLVCDIGGTNLRAGLIQINSKTNEKKSIKIISHITNDYSSFEDFYTSIFISELPKENHPHLAVIGLAGAVYDNKANSTNIYWGEIDGDKLSQKLGVTKVIIMNDLEAIAHGVTTLDKGDLVQINDAIIYRNKPMLVISPGTGFGSAFLTPDFQGENSYEVWQSESGYANYGPGGSLQHEFYEYIKFHFSYRSIFFKFFKFFQRKKNKVEFVWVEEMICGKAILHMFEFLKLKFKYNFN